MPRGPRIHVPNGTFHVLSRGNRRQKIFEERADWQKFLDLLGEYFTSAGIALYAYCLMPNHFHLIVRAALEPLAAAVHPLLTAFSTWSNKKYDRVGHVFQDRFKAIHCDNDAYLKHVVRYTHLNPVRAGLVAEAEEWEWSSHKAYLDPGVQGPADPGFVLSAFSSDVGQARKLYAQFMAADDAPRHQDPASVRRNPKEMISLADAVAAEHGLGAAELRGTSRATHCAQARERFVIAALRDGFRPSDIADYLQRGRSWVSAVKSGMDEAG